MASVMMPAGFVKFMTYASGARSLIVCAARTITGTVRMAYARPPGPVVS